MFYIAQYAFTPFWSVLLANLCSQIRFNPYNNFSCDKSGKKKQKRNSLSKHIKISIFLIACLLEKSRNDNFILNSSQTCLNLNMRESLISPQILWLVSKICKMFLANIEQNMAIYKACRLSAANHCQKLSYCPSNQIKPKKVIFGVH